ncbi:hypothetical protein phiOC_p072 [Ochrobactrum phage vB_OspM_OC]|nr:hypothetical protein phiOC_p072 [Ochrobactrum phage vB_OspM_OC]
MNFILVHDEKIDLVTIENMIPWEREYYIMSLNKRIMEQNQKAQNNG